jgi:hypothetical protein
VTDTLATSTITHAFHTGNGPWWELCERCGLAESAHRSTLVSGARDREFAALEHRCPDCVSARDFGKAMAHLPGECPR